MRKILCAIALLALVTPAFASDKFVGTWQLNTQKSTGPSAPTAEQLVAVDDGTDQLITVTGKAPDGSPTMTKFSIPIKGGKGKIVDAVPFTGVVSKPYTATTEDFLFTIDDKPAMHIHSVLSIDGKMMTTSRKVISGPVKPGTYTDIWEKQ
jgi:hypothetical protein